jgi:tRNA pseudouridine55 synthase
MSAHGVLLVDKPAGITSHDVVAGVRRAARSRRVGHAGTLDPFATGLLVLAVGAYTRVLPYLDGEPKVYEAQLRFGIETDTDDGTGRVVREAPLPDWARLDAAIATLTGDIAQVPPAYSAKHVDGQRAHQLARRGHELHLAAVPVRVQRWELLDQGPDRLDVRITCGGGTYIRALARDLGRALGSAACCATLRRIASGPARVEDAVPWSAVTPGAIADGTVPLRSPLDLLGAVEILTLDADGLVHLGHGRPPAVASGSADRVAFVDGHGTLVGIGARHDGRWQPRVVLLQELAA